MNAVVTAQESAPFQVYKVKISIPFGVLVEIHNPAPEWAEMVTIYESYKNFIEDAIREAIVKSTQPRSSEVIGGTTKEAESKPRRCDYWSENLSSCSDSYVAHHCVLDMFHEGDHYFGKTRLSEVECAAPNAGVEIPVGGAAPIDGMPVAIRLDGSFSQYSQAELDAAVMVEHSNHVEFANDMYAILVDPCGDEYSMKEQELFAACRKAALESRERLLGRTRRFDSTPSAGVETVVDIETITEKLKFALTSLVDAWHVEGKSIVHKTGDGPLIHNHKVHPQTLALIVDALNFSVRRLALQQFLDELPAMLALLAASHQESPKALPKKWSEYNHYEQDAWLLGYESGFAALADERAKARLETAERMQNLTPLGQDEYMRELRAIVSSKKF